MSYAIAAWIMVVGLYGVVTSRNLIHLIICLTVVRSSTYVLLLSVGYKTDGVPPVFFDVPPSPRAVDPVVQALTLTDVVVSVAIAALLLAVAIQVRRRHRSGDPEELSAVKG